MRRTCLKETFAKANLPAEIEVYAGAAHGWCPPDSQVYNEPQAEKAWSRLIALTEKPWPERPCAAPFGVRSASSSHVSERAPPYARNG